MSKFCISWRAIMPAILLSSACGQQEAGDTADEPQASPMGVACGGIAAPARTPSAAGARVFFITPGDGDTVSGPVRLEFGLSGMEVAPAGEDRPGSGHHHIVIDSELPLLGLPVPADEHHVHFGDGRTETELTLPPGEHTLQLLFADHLHIPHDPPLLSEQIRITVE
jgi:hypothetical protein